MSRSDDKKFMRRAIALAKAGEGWVHPNPLVGAVIVKDGRIIGEGYHRKYGELHAERNAIASLAKYVAAAASGEKVGSVAASPGETVGSEGPASVMYPAEGATIYVTLEPCCHHGKTPPCTEAIIEQKIARVVIGSRDPNPLVAGKGARILREAGIEVVEDFLREECDALNPVFFHHITTKTPYVIMKYAMTADGKIATKTGASKWITGDEARQEVQRLRHACMGIMAGIGTVLADDPLLNCRLENGRHPVRILCDSKLRIPLDSQICRTAGEYETIVACGDPALPEGEIDTLSKAGRIPVEEMRTKIQKLMELGITVVNVPEQAKGDDAEASRAAVDLRKLMEHLGDKGIDSILLEGGGVLNDSALRAGIVNEVRAFIAPKFFGGTAKSPVEGVGVTLPDQAVQMRLADVQTFGEDLMLRFRL